jgi:hypothetical protein
LEEIHKVDWTSSTSLASWPLSIQVLMFYPH